jgi:hypothetical protein
MFSRNGLIPIIALFSGLAACAQGDIVGPGNDAPPPPPPQPPAVRTYDVVVALTQLTALGDCDRNERVAGVSVGGPGEFAYTIWTSADGATVGRVQTPDFGKWGTLAASRLIENGRSYNLNQTMRLTRRTGQTFTFGIAAIEWDGVALTVRDKDLNGQVKQREFNLEEIGDAGMGLDVEVGDNVDNCGLRLTYTVNRYPR